MYQGDNRYRLENIQFFQHRLETAQEGKWFVRGYFTNEDAGDTYDIFTTACACRMPAAPPANGTQATSTCGTVWIKPRIRTLRCNPDYYHRARSMRRKGSPRTAAYDAYITQFVADNQDAIHSATTK